MKSINSTNSVDLNNNYKIESTNVLLFSNFTGKTFFKEFSLCGSKIPAIYVDDEELSLAIPYLVEQGLLNPGDDLKEEMKCDFYKQCLHGVIWELRNREVTSTEIAA